MVTTEKLPALPTPVTATVTAPTEIVMVPKLPALPCPLTAIVTAPCEGVTVPNEPAEPCPVTATVTAPSAVVIAPKAPALPCPVTGTFWAPEEADLKIARAPDCFLAVVRVTVLDSPAPVREPIFSSVCVSISDDACVTI